MHVQDHIVAAHEHSSSSSDNLPCFELALVRKHSTVHVAASCVDHCVFDCTYEASLESIQSVNECMKHYWYMRQQEASPGRIWEGEKASCSTSLK